MATIDTIREVLVENLDLDADAITEEATLESLGVDSLDMVELICDCLLYTSPSPRDAHESRMASSA